MPDITQKISWFDRAVISRMNRWFMPFSRFALFVIFFWFGALKVFGLSPANPLVAQLLEHTMPFISFAHFIVVFGIFEVIIGVLFLVKGMERLAIVFLALHMATTLMPLILVPEATWSGFFVPTLEGQYIIKNLAIIAVAMGILAHKHPYEEEKISARA